MQRAAWCIQVGQHQFDWCTHYQAAFVWTYSRLAGVIGKVNPGNSDEDYGVDICRNKTRGVRIYVLIQYLRTVEVTGSSLNNSHLSFSRWCSSPTFVGSLSCVMPW